MTIKKKVNQTLFGTGRLDRNETGGRAQTARVVVAEAGPRVTFDLELVLVFIHDVIVTHFYRARMLV